ncbi:MAG: hypothetical protein ACMUJM_25565 [bacterium]
MLETQYQRLKERIIESNPDAKHRKLCLADVLLALSNQNVSIMSNGYFVRNNTQFQVKWNFENDFLDAQSDECKSFLYDILI